MLLTGSNMSGKTTFIRSLAINCIYSQSLNISFSKKFESPFLKIFSLFEHKMILIKVPVFTLTKS